MALHFYAQRKNIKDGAGLTPANYYYPTLEEAERQFHLLCASAIQNSDGYETSAVEYGSVERGIVDRKVYIFAVETQEESEPVEG